MPEALKYYKPQKTVSVASKKTTKKTAKKTTQKSQPPKRNMTTNE